MNKAEPFCDIDTLNFASTILQVPYGICLCYELALQLIKPWIVLTYETSRFRPDFAVINVGF